MNLSHHTIKQAVQNYERHTPLELIAPYHNLSPLLGYDKLASICEQLGGSHVYVPSLQHLFKQAIVSDMATQFDGRNYRELAQSYGLSERTARNYLR